MSFLCPQCQHETLGIEHTLELPPDSLSDEIMLQLIRCATCGFAGAGVYEESRRGALDSESWHHDGYTLPTADLQRLQRLMAHCPHPHDSDCDCPTHRALTQRNAWGRWQIHLLVTVKASFPIQRRQ